jgi:hypothetical protein
MLSLFVLGALFWLPGAAPQENPPGKPVIRSCPDSWNDAVPHGKKGASSGKKKVAPIKSGACIELAFSSLEIQEYLQSYARQQAWIIATDQLNDDSWTFSLEIDKEELLRDTLAESNPKGVEWTGGSVRVHMNALQLPDGLTRATLRASFRGFGRNTDQFAIHKDYWELESSNAFENSVIAALRDHFSQLPAEKLHSTQPSP